MKKRLRNAGQMSSHEPAVGHSSFHVNPFSESLIHPETLRAPATEKLGSKTSRFCCGAELLGEFF